MTKFTSIDEYIATHDEQKQALLIQLRAILKKSLPNAYETIAYNMPAYKQGVCLIYFAAHKNHIGLYPTAWPIKALAKELTNFKYSKGAIQFPVNKKLPVKLIQKIAKCILTNAKHK